MAKGVSHKKEAKKPKKAKKQFLKKSASADFFIVINASKSIKNKLKKEKHWDANRNAFLKRHFGIDQKEYENILEKQDFKCAICLKSKSSKNLDIDHCHTTGKVRGLLCRSCNMGLGYYKDNPELLEKAADYLRRIPYQLAAIV